MSNSIISSRASLRGHALHPALIHFPIAFLLILIVTDTVFILTSDPFWAEASFWLTAAGLAFGVLASLAGAIDVFTVRIIRHIVAAWAHAVLAVMTLSLTTFNLTLRLGDDPGELINPWGIYVSVLAGILIGITGFLGAQLVFAYGVGVNEPQNSERQVEP